MDVRGVGCAKYLASAIYLPGLIEKFSSKLNGIQR